MYISAVIILSWLIWNSTCDMIRTTKKKSLFLQIVLKCYLTAYYFVPMRIAH